MDLEVKRAIGRRVIAIYRVKIELHVRDNMQGVYKETRSLKWQAEDVLLEEDEMYGD
jgi:hypothetical protein